MADAADKMKNSKDGGRREMGVFKCHVPHKSLYFFNFYYHAISRYLEKTVNQQDMTAFMHILGESSNFLTSHPTNTLRNCQGFGK